MDGIWYRAKDPTISEEIEKNPTFIRLRILLLPNSTITDFPGSKFHWIEYGGHLKWLILVLNLIGLADLRTNPKYNL